MKTCNRTNSVLKPAFLAALFLASAASLAQPSGWVTIGNGTTTNGATTYPAPYGNWYWGAKHQFLIKASEITAAGGVAGTISQLGFYVQVPQGTALAGFTISLGHTTQNSLTGTYITGLTTVLLPTTYIDVAGWNDHTLLPLFSWNGTDNVVVEVCFNNGSYTYNAQMRYTNTSFTSATVYWADAAGVCSQTSGSVYSQRTNMRLNMNLCNVAPVADFTSNIQTTCVGGPSVNFTDLSWCFPTSWSWTFQGGTPNTSTAQNPTVSYSAPGTYDVTLVATNSNGSDTEVKTGYITVTSICPVILGTGTTYNSQFGYPAPYGNRYWGAKHQFLIKASEITAAGGNAGLIQSLAFNVAIPQGTPLNGFTIKMGNTSVNALTTTFQTPPMTTVYGPATYTETSGWNTHAFSTPFYWNGSSNVLVEVCFNNTSLTYNARTYYTNMGYAASAIRYTNTSTVCGMTTATTTSFYRPNMKLDIQPCSGPPLADFVASTTNVCAGNSVTFTDLSGCVPTSWSWTFGGGTPGTSTNQNPTVTYSTPGTYNVTLVATNASGADTLIKTGYIVVTAPPCPVIVGTGTTTNSNTGYPAPYGNWYWGARHQFLVKGSEITSAGGGAGIIQSLAFNVAVPQGTPLQGFHIKIAQTSLTALTSTFQTIPMTTVFGPQTYTETSGWNAHAFSTPFYWDGTSNLLVEVCFNNTSYTYNAQCYNSTYGYVATTYYRADASGVCSQPTGTASMIRPNMQFIIAPCGTPVVAFSASTTTPCAGSNVTFTDLSGCTPTSWSWTFQGGNPGTSSNQNPVIAYNTPGTYNVTLIATNSNGSDTLIKSGYITVTGAPVANFTSNITVTCVGGGAVNFTDLSTNCPTSWSWTFAGGTPPTSTSQNPSVTYSSPGTYDVTLVASNGQGSDTETKTGYVTVQTTCPIIIGTGTNMNSTTGYPAPYGNWYWGARHQILVKASELIAGGGAAGMIDGIGFQVAIPQGTPLQGFYVKVGTTTVNTLTSTFETPTWLGTWGPLTYTETGGWNDHMLSIPFYWNGTDNLIIETCFNNGSYTYNARHYYTNSGFSSTSYRYQDAAGMCTQPTAFGVTANRPNLRIYNTPCSGPPVINFSASPSTLVCTGGTVNFTDLSTCTPTAWSWTFPGGSPGTSTAQNPTVTYSTNGTYDVTLTATNSNGSDTLTKTGYITVTNAPIPNFSASSTNTTVNIPIDFTDLSTCSTPTSWSWSFPGAVPSTASTQNPTVQYPLAGVYNVSLTVSNSNGSNSITKTGYITITNQMVVDPTWTVNDLVDLILGNGVTASNITSNCHPLARGYFAGGNTGIPEGLIMSSGNVLYAPGPNTSSSTSYANGYPGDPFLDIWAGITTQNACIIEFDIVFTCDSVQMTYLFGTEEYNEYVGSTYNDVFGFFVSGSGFPAPTNFAWVPGTVAVPITVNTVNNGSGNPPSGPCTNCAFFNSNAPPFVTNNSIEYDGYTTVLKSGTIVVPGLPYHLKLAIADGTDQVWDAAVLIAKEGLSSIQMAGCVLLNVDIISFTGTASEGVNHLQWVTANESNLSHYEVMRSYTGFDWEKIGEMDARGASGTASYIFSDETFTDVVTYYRLRMIDHHGQQQFSNVVQLVNPSAMAFDIVSVQSDKGSNQVELAFTSDSEGPVELTLCNLPGQVVLRQVVDASVGLNKLTFVIPDYLDLGVYLVGITKNEEKRSVKFIY